MKKKYCLVTGSRAEYGILKHLIKKLQNFKKIDFDLVVTGTHLSKNYGMTIEELNNDKITISKKINLNLNKDKKKDIAIYTANCVSEFAKYFSKKNYDLLIVLGDRYEIFGVVIASYFLNIPIAHFHGGELTKGLIDDGIRHSITKMSNYHFVSNIIYKKRVMQLGESEKNIFVVGSLSLDNIKNINLYSKKYIEKKLNFKFRENNIIFTYHPVTLEKSTAERQIKIILKSLDKFKNIGIIFTLSNSDPENRLISKEIIKYTKLNKNRCVAYSSLGLELYFSSMKYCQCVVGNSSSGIIEAPSFNIPTLNIGDRQEGRVKSNSTIDTKCSVNEITKKLKILLYTSKYKNKKFTNPYYKKNSVNKSFNKIVNIKIDKNIKKNFEDIVI